MGLFGFASSALESTQSELFELKNKQDDIGSARCVESAINIFVDLQLHVHVLCHIADLLKLTC